MSMSDDFLDGMNDFIDPDGCHDKATGKWQKERPGWVDVGVVARVSCDRIEHDALIGEEFFWSQTGYPWLLSHITQWWSEPIEGPPKPTEENS